MRALLSVAVTVLALPGSPAHGTDDALGFDTTVAIPAIFGGEPSIVVDRDATPDLVYVTDIGINIHRSADGGVSFAQGASVPEASGDAHVVTDADGTLYALALEETRGSDTKYLPVYTSLDHGDSFARHLYLSNELADRPWAAARGHGHVVVIGKVSGVIQSWVSHDAAQSFDGPHAVDFATFSSPPVFAADDSLHFVYATGDSVRIARSVDGGANWTTGQISAIETGRFTVLIPGVAADIGGTVYAVWAEGTKYVVTPALSAEVRFSASTDHGETWSSPATLSTPGHSALFPTVTAGGAGRVDVAFFSSRTSLTPDVGPDLGWPTTVWDVVVTQSLNANSEHPAFTYSVAAGEVHQGSICTLGAYCLGQGILNVPLPEDRRVGDFFLIDHDSDGRALVTFPVDRPAIGGGLGEALFATTDAVVARQTSGPVIK